MQTVFFAAEPSDDDFRPVEQAGERVPSFEPPRDELPMLLAVSQVVARSEDVVIALLGARVYSDGVELLFDRRIRRGERDERAWHIAQMDFAGHWGSLREPARLRWGVVLGDGTTLRLDDLFGVPEPQGESPTIRMTGGGGGGGGGDYTINDGLWLWPLPPEGPLEVVVQWPAFGIPESRIELDGGRIRALASEVRPLWG